MNDNKNAIKIIIGIVLVIVGISMAIYGFSTHVSYGPSYHNNGINITLAESKSNNSLVGFIGVILGISGAITIKSVLSNK